MSQLPNALDEDKAGYLRSCLIGRPRVKHGKLLADIALIFYHCEVPLDDASRYLDIFESKKRAPSAPATRRK